MRAHPLVRTVAAAVIVSASAARADAQVAGKQERANVAGIDVLNALGLPLLSGGNRLEIPFTFEHAFTPVISGYGTFSLRGQNTVLFPSLAFAFTYGVSAGARFYQAGDAPHGFWTGARVWYSPGDRNLNFPGLTGSGVRILGELGYQWIAQNGFALELSAGWDQIGAYITATSNPVLLVVALGGLRASIVVGWNF